MSRHNLNHLMRLTTLILLTCFLVSCDTNRNSNNIYTNCDIYASSIKEEFSDYNINHQTYNKNRYHHVSDGDIVTALDVEVKDLLQGSNFNFREDCLVTIVLAINRNQTDVQIDSWADLKYVDESVDFNFEYFGRAPVISAIAYGLDGQDYKIKSAIKYLEYIYSQGRLTYNNYDADILICFDIQAIELINQGKNYEIVVPKEGTLSFSLGIITNQKVKINKNNKLIDNFRLMDGSSDNEAYPLNDAYQSASRVLDYESYQAKMANATHILRRQVFHEHLLNSADGLEGILFPLAVIMITVFWLTSALYRSPNNELRKAFIAIAVFIILWLTLRMIKYNTPNSIFSTYLWYGYYISMLGLPLCLLYITIIIDRPNCSRNLPTWFKIISLLYPILLTLVLTNNFHNLVFIIKDDFGDDYSYNFLFYIIFAYSILLFIISILLLIYKARYSPKNHASIHVIVLGLLLVAYNICHDLNIPIFGDSDVTVVQCLFSLIFLETTFHLGIIPNNTHYEDLFKLSPQSIQIINNQAEVINSSENAFDLDKMDILKLMSETTTSIIKNNDTVIHSRKIKGGLVVWHENISELNELHQKISDSITNLETTNAILSKNNEIKKRKLALDIKTKLFDLLDKNIRCETNELSKNINNLPEEVKDVDITYITILLCHIKRSCNLFFLSQENKYISADELSVYIDELSEFALYADVKALVRIGKLEDINLQIATLCYDFYFNLLIWAIKDSKATLIGQLNINDNQLNFNFLSSESLDSIYFSQNFNDKLKQLSATIASREVEDNREISLNCKIKEENIHV